MGEGDSIVLSDNNYSNKEINEILDSMTIIIDSREKVNVHITSIFDKQNVKYAVRKLNHGDYSFYVPQNETLGISEDVSFENCISIERKNSVDELAGSYSTTRKQFEAEHQRHKGKMILLVENDEYHDICEGNYRSKLKPKSFMATIHTWQHRYSVPFIFVKKEYSALYIYYTLRYWLRNYLTNS